MHQIARELPGYDAWFSPHYCGGVLEVLRKAGLLEFTILGNKYIRRCLDYLETHNLNIDFQGKKHRYDLVVTCSDLIVPANIRNGLVILVQEGMTDPETWVYRLTRVFRFLPRWLSGTAAMGLSGIYDYFCVASDGYRNLFIRKGANPDRLIVTGIPNFDNCRKYLNNGFPHRNYVLVCTSDIRETYRFENRRKFIERSVGIANGRLLIFKLHPNENIGRATKEIGRFAPGALVYSSGNTEEMIANCDVLITRYSSTVYVGLALGKEVYSDFDVEELRNLTPIQNGSAARRIAGVCHKLLDASTSHAVRHVPGHRPSRIRRAAELLFQRIAP
jgi:hypothetical protein